MASLRAANDPAELAVQADRPLWRELLTTGISVTLALGVALAVLHAPTTRLRSTGPAHSLPAAGATPAVAGATSATAAPPVAPASASGTGLAQLPPDHAIPPLALRALAQTDTAAAAPALTVYLVGTQAQAAELAAGLSVVNAIRATGGAPALHASVVVNGPDASAAIDTIRGHWMPAQIVDLQ